MLANTLRELRIDKGLSQLEAAKQIGISQSMLAMLETGQRGGGDLTKIKVAKFYNKSVEALFFAPLITKRDLNDDKNH